MMLQHVKDYSFAAADYDPPSYARTMKEPSAPVWCPSTPKSADAILPKGNEYELSDFNEFSSYVKIEPADIEHYIPHLPHHEPFYPQYTPFYQQKYQVMPSEDVQENHGRSIRENVEKIQEILTKIFKQLLYLAITGVNSPEYVPSFIAIWSPVAIESTISRRNRYLRECKGNQIEATEKCILRNHGPMRRFKIGGLETIPYLGAMAGHTVNLWHQLREITLIAAIHGHDVLKDDVQAKILSCLVGGNVFKVASLSIDLVIRKIAKDMILKLGIKENFAGAIPLNVVFNFFTHDAAKVSGHAKKMFGGKNSLPVSGFN